MGIDSTRCKKQWWARMLAFTFGTSTDVARGMIAGAERDAMRSDAVCERGGKV